MTYSKWASLSGLCASLVSGQNTNFLPTLFFKYLLTNDDISKKLNLPGFENFEQNNNNTLFSNNTDSVILMGGYVIPASILKLTIFYPLLEPLFFWKNQYTFSYHLYSKWLPNNNDIELNKHIEEIDKTLYNISCLHYIIDLYEPYFISGMCVVDTLKKQGVFDFSKNVTSLVQQPIINNQTITIINKESIENTLAEMKIVFDLCFNEANEYINIYFFNKNNEENEENEENYTRAPRRSLLQNRYLPIMKNLFDKYIANSNIPFSCKAIIINLLIKSLNINTKNKKRFLSISNLYYDAAEEYFTTATVNLLVYPGDMYYHDALYDRSSEYQWILRKLSVHFKYKIPSCHNLFTDAKDMHIIESINLKCYQTKDEKNPKNLFRLTKEEYIFIIKFLEDILPLSLIDKNDILKLKEDYKYSYSIIQTMHTNLFKKINELLKKNPYT